VNLCENNHALFRKRQALSKLASSEARSVMRRSIVVPGALVDAPENPLSIAADNIIRRLRLLMLAPLSRAYRKLARRAETLQFSRARLQNP
jgi:hypothetical protein